MKFLVVLALIGMACAVPTPMNGAGDLAAGLRYFRENLPLTEARGIFTVYADGDSEVCEMANRVKAGANPLLDAVAKVQGVQDLLTILESQNVPIIPFIQEIYAALGIVRGGVATPRSCTTSSMGGVRSLMTRLRPMLDVNRTLGLINSISAVNSEFADFFAILESKRGVLNEVRVLPEVVGLISMLKSYGVDTDYIVAFIQALFGWS
ncbi:unnamed protein product [Diamesa hyperborea]